MSSQPSYHTASCRRPSRGRLRLMALRIDWEGLIVGFESRSQQITHFFDRETGDVEQVLVRDAERHAQMSARSALRRAAAGPGRAQRRRPRGVSRRVRGRGVPPGARGRAAGGGLRRRLPRDAPALPEGGGALLPVQGASGARRARRLARGAGHPVSRAARGRVSAGARCRRARRPASSIRPIVSSALPSRCSGGPGRRAAAALQTVGARGACATGALLVRFDGRDRGVGRDADAARTIRSGRRTSSRCSSRPHAEPARSTTSSRSIRSAPLFDARVESPEGRARDDARRRRAGTARASRRACGARPRRWSARVPDPALGARRRSGRVWRANFYRIDRGVARRVLGLEPDGRGPARLPPAGRFGFGCRLVGAPRRGGPTRRHFSFQSRTMLKPK